MDKYVVEVDGEKYIVHANLSEASAPIIVDGNPTQFQTANACHNVSGLLSCVLDYLGHCQSTIYSWEESDEFSDLVDTAMVAYADAAGSWDSLDWCHPVLVGTTDPYERDCQEIDLSDWSVDELRKSPPEDATEDQVVEWIEYLEQVASDATAAEEQAKLAYNALDEGDWASALKHAENACGIESTYGDCPTWGDFRDAVREVVDSL